MVPARPPGRAEADADPLGRLGGQAGPKLGAGGGAVADGQGDAEVEDLAGVADQLGVALLWSAGIMLVSVVAAAGAFRRRRR